MPNIKYGVIVGGSGFIGGALLHYLGNVLKTENMVAPNSKELNLGNKKSIAAYFRYYQPKFIINAALADIGSNAKKSYEINYVGAMQLANVALSHGVPYIHISSSAVLENGHQVGESKLRKLLSDQNNYTKSKLMCELTLEELHKKKGLDYTSVRLGIVYGKYDYTVQGFHRLLFAVATQTMPVILCRKGVCHSYTNHKKISVFISYLLENRKEFIGQSVNFVDSKPIEFSKLIILIRDYLKYKKPYEMYMPLSIARFGLSLIKRLKLVAAKIGVETRMPPELMFLENLYETQTLSVDKLKSSSFKDPYPDQNILTELPHIIDYYIKRWTELQLISHSRFGGQKRDKQVQAFKDDPETLLCEIHHGELEPFGYDYTVEEVQGKSSH